MQSDAQKSLRRENQVEVGTPGAGGGAHYRRGTRTSKGGIRLFTLKKGGEKRGKPDREQDD